MGRETRCGPAVRIKQRKDWFVPLVAATVFGAALLVLDLYDGGSAQARPTSAVLVGARDKTSCESRGDRATATLLGSISGTVFAAGDNVYEKGSLSEYNDCYRRTGDTTRTVPCQLLATTSILPAGQRDTSTTSARPRATSRRATTPTTSDPGTWSS